MSDAGREQHGPGQGGQPQAAAAGRGEAGAALNPARPRRGWLSAALFRTLGRGGAKAGAAWLGVVALAAVVAPFVASSHPIVMETANGEVRSPMWEHLTAFDVALPIAAAMGVLFVFRPKRWTPRRRLAVWAAASMGAWLVLLPITSPPELVVYERYRTMQAEGEIAWAVHAPIPYSPTDRQRDRPDAKKLAPSLDHLMGTTINGEDLASRMIHASRIAMSIGFIATGLASVIGVVIGSLMGYFSKLVDLLGMRLVEIFEAIPQLYLLLTFVAVLPPELNPYRLYFIMVIIGLTSWTGYARFTRAEFLRLRAMDYVTAALALGVPLHAVLLKHMLPNGVAPVLVTASFGVASAIIAESTLSFLGLGLVDEPSWGQMLSQAIQATGSFLWWMATFPGLAIFLTVFAYNLIGESLRDAIDPKADQG